VNNRNITAVIAGIIIFILAFLVWVWTASLKEIKEPTAKFPEIGNQEKIGVLDSRENPAFSSAGETLVGESRWQPMEIQIEDNLFKKEFEKLVYDFSEVKLDASAVQPKTSSAEILSDEELFNLAYPDYYLDYLNDMKDIMAESGFLDASTAPKWINFTSEDEVTAFLDIFIIFLAQEGTITAEQLKDFQKGIHITLRDLNEREKILRQQKLLKSRFFKKYFSLRVKMLDSAIKQQVYKLFANKAFAFVEGSTPEIPTNGGGGGGVIMIDIPNVGTIIYVPGMPFPILVPEPIMDFLKPAIGQITGKIPGISSIPGLGGGKCKKDSYSGECYQEKNSGYSSVGSNLWAPCCNCEQKVGNKCRPVGCLNKVCEGKNAIWHPQTGICGCG